MILRSGGIVGKIGAGNNKPNEAGNVVQPNGSGVVISFDPNSVMNIKSWLRFFNDRCHDCNFDDTWKVRNIGNYLKGDALSEYVNAYATLITWEEWTSFFTERFLCLDVVKLSDFTSKVLDEDDNLNTYFQEKLKIGRKLGLATQIILEGLSDGLFIPMRQLLVINSPKTYGMVGNRYKIDENPESGKWQ